LKESKRKIYGEIEAAAHLQLVDVAANVQRIYIGYSGGVDSHVLLHACAALPEFKAKITAVYIHHGLQFEADEWAIHCAKIAEKLGVAFLMQRVYAHPNSGESPEEAARNARYAAFKNLINENDVLLIAQHREDQLETVLLQLFRGSGLRGLAGMPEKTPFGDGELLRPLLNISKETINIYAAEHQLNWIEDPSNQSTIYDRNFLRREIIPHLKQRWQSLDKTVARAATHCAEAQTVISNFAQTQFETVFNLLDNTLNILALQTYSPSEQRLIVRQWFDFLDLKMPSHNFVQRILNDVMAARVDSSPILTGHGVNIRRYRTKLYAMTHVLTGFEWCEWEHEKTTLTLSNQQILAIQSADCGISHAVWHAATITVKMRRGGETLALPNRDGHHELKKLFQEANIPPWQRENMPLIYLNGELAAVGNLWIAAAFFTEKMSACVKIVCE